MELNPREPQIVVGGRNRERSHLLPGGNRKLFSCWLPRTRRRICQLNRPQPPAVKS